VLEGATVNVTAGKDGLLFNGEASAARAA
jgi:hypothetical protein